MFEDYKHHMKPSAIRKIRWLQLSNFSQEFFQLCQKTPCIEMYTFLNLSAILGKMNAYKEMHKLFSLVSKK